MALDPRLAQLVEGPPPTSSDAAFSLLETAAIFLEAGDNRTTRGLLVPHVERLALAVRDMITMHGPANLNVVLLGCSVLGLLTDEQEPGQETLGNGRVDIVSFLVNDVLLLRQPPPGDDHRDRRVAERVYFALERIIGKHLRNTWLLFDTMQLHLRVCATFRAELNVLAPEPRACYRPPQGSRVNLTPQDQLLRRTLLSRCAAMLHRLSWLERVEYTLVSPPCEAHILLIHALNSFHDDPELERRCCATLGNLAFERSLEFKLLDEPFYTGQAVHNAMIRHPYHAKLQTHACNTIFNLSVSKATYNRLVSTAPKVTSTVAMILTNHINDLDAVGKALSCLQRILRFDSARVGDLLPLQTPKWVLQALRMTSDIDVMDDCVDVLATILDNAALSDLHQHNVYSTIAQAMMAIANPTQTISPPNPVQEPTGEETSFQPAREDSWPSHTSMRRATTVMRIVLNCCSTPRHSDGAQVIFHTPGLIERVVAMMGYHAVSYVRIDPLAFCNHYSTRIMLQLVLASSAEDLLRLLTKQYDLHKTLSGVVRRWSHLLAMHCIVAQIVVTMVKSRHDTTVILIQPPVLLHLLLARSLATYVDCLTWPSPQRINQPELLCEALLAMLQSLDDVDVLQKAVIDLVRAPMSMVTVIKDGLIRRGEWRLPMLRLLHQLLATMCTLDAKAAGDAVDAEALLVSLQACVPQLKRRQPGQAATIEDVAWAIDHAVWAIEPTCTTPH